MARAVTLREHLALAALTREFDAIKAQFDGERLTERRDTAEREAHRLGRDPIVLGPDDVQDAAPLLRVRRRWE